MSESRTDKPGRAAAQAVSSIAASKARFIAWLDANAGGEEKLAEELKSLRASPDPRVRARAIETEVRLRGYFEHEQGEASEPTIVFHLGVPKTRHPEGELPEGDA